MNSRIPFWLCIIFSVVIGWIGLTSLRSPIVFYDSGSWNAKEFVRIHQGHLRIQYLEPLSGPTTQDRNVDFPGFTYLTRKWNRTHLIKISLWIPFLLFALYPICSILLVPFQKAYRRSKCLCAKCKYQLTGNESEVCPECGAAVVHWITPRWERFINALLCAVIVALLLEFINQQGAIEHRFAIWLIRNFGIEGGSWYITASIRSMCYTMTGIGVYYYLSPERFQDKN